jgi:hypothetical protein
MLYLFLPFSRQPGHPLTFVAGGDSIIFLKLLKKSGKKIGVCCCSKYNIQNQVNSRPFKPKKKAVSK